MPVWMVVILSAVISATVLYGAKLRKNGREQFGDNVHVYASIASIFIAVAIMFSRYDLWAFLPFGGVGIPMLFSSVRNTL